MPKHGIKLETLPEYPIKREAGYLYYLDKNGYVWKSKMRYLIRKEKKGV
jgi:hypothetical protein